MRCLLGTEGKILCLQDFIEGIRKAYEEDWYASKVRERQMAVALYFIDKLALRAGHEKDEDEADTVGCCTLKASACFTVHLKMHHSRPKNVPVDVLTVELMLLPVSLSTTVDFAIFGFACKAPRPCSVEIQKRNTSLYSTLPFVNTK